MEVRANPVASFDVLPDPEILFMLADRTPQAVALFGADLTPQYINPALRHMLAIAADACLIDGLSCYHVRLRQIDDCKRPIVETLHRIGEWHGEISVHRDDMPGWSLTLRGRVALLRTQGVKRGFAIVASIRNAVAGAIAPKLTIRERDVLSALLSGATSKGIAQQLGISHRTVEAHRANIMQKFDVKSLPELFRRTISEAAAD